jgi:hypothetical protein
LVKQLQYQADQDCHFDREVHPFGQLAGYLQTQSIVN